MRSHWRYLWVQWLILERILRSLELKQAIGEFDGEYSAGTGRMHDLAEIIERIIDNQKYTAGHN
jgi:hypothetical protein